MAKKSPLILAISSQVVRGTVGLSIAVPCFQAIGCEVWPLPTTLLSNHPGLAEPQGRGTTADDLIRISAVLRRENWLERVDGILTGYIAGPGQIEAIVGLIHQVKSANPDVVYACDPVLGDTPGGLYVKESVAEAIRDKLLPLADITTPNMFELSWLTGWDAEGQAAVPRIALKLPPNEVLVTSIPGRKNSLHVHAALKSGRGLWSQVRTRPRAPNGLGDGFTALYLGNRLKGHSPAIALGRTMAAIEHLIDQSQGQHDLTIGGLGQGLKTLDPWPVETGGFGT